MLRTFFLWALFALSLSWLAGLIGFALATDRLAGQASEASLSADAIVVLTGGSGERISFAAELLGRGAAKQMLVSGVNAKVTPEDLRLLSGLSKEKFACCVDVGFQAQNTTGNAYEISTWAHKEGFETLLVVTSSYHMPRALIELRRIDPQLKLIAAPVRSIGAAKQHVFRRTLVEYTKYLVVLFTRSNKEEAIRMTRAREEAA
jgi:uncharacterized SAM-binding protein YcdF (DUF218 family)